MEKNPKLERDKTDSCAKTKATPRQRTKRYSAPALEKGLEILEYLSTERASRSLGEIAHALSRSKGEIFRMVTVLEERNFLNRDEGTESYHVTNKLFQLGMRRPINRMIVQAALPGMNTLSEKVHYPCQLAVMSGTQIVVIAREDTSDQLSFAVRVGFRRAAIKTGSGLCLIAFMLPSQRQRFFDLLKEEKTQFDQKKLDDEITLIRECGYTARPSTTTIGVTDMSCPITDSTTGGVMAALTIPYLELIEHPIAIEDVAKEMIRTAAEISSKLG